jgi:hypothetical protein
MAKPRAVEAISGEFATDDETAARDRARAERDERRAREGNRKAFEVELASYEYRLVLIADALEALEPRIAEAADHWKAPLIAERDELLRRRDGYEGQCELVKLEIKKWS